MNKAYSRNFNDSDRNVSTINGHERVVYIESFSEMTWTIGLSVWGVTGQNGSGQNGMDKIVYGQNGIGQNGTILYFVYNLIQLNSIYI